MFNLLGFSRGIYKFVWEKQLVVNMYLVSFSRFLFSASLSLTFLALLKKVS